MDVFDFQDVLFFVTLFEGLILVKMATQKSFLILFMKVRILVIQHTLV